MAERLESCATCRWWEAPSSAETDAGVCRRHAPLVVAVPSSPSALSVGTPFWPRTRPGEFCGDWQPHGGGQGGP